MKKSILSSVFFVVSSVCAVAMADDSDHKFITPGDIVWVDAPASLPAGAKASILFGDLTKAEPFAIRVKMPAGYRIPPHTHPADENVTVISGTLHIAMGREEDRSHMMALPQGSFARMTAGAAHYVRSEGEVIVQINGVGPWGITYINLEDDPRN